MDTFEILISLSVVIIISYIFDVFSIRTKLPAVVLLMLLGAGIKFGISFWGINVDAYELRVKQLLPILGTLGLIFIVLEGALELEINHSKRKVLWKSFLAALLVLLLNFLAVAMWLHYGCGQEIYPSLLNAVPVSVISSAIAIPSVVKLRKQEKEFVIYESSFSDIIGVMVFNFILLNTTINFASFLHLGTELFLILVISILATISLGFLFERLGHHKKFILLLAILILVYALAKQLHLSALILIFIFGLFAGNSEFFIHKVLKQRFKMHVLQRELHRFQSFIIEFAFVIRTFFFVIFGFSINFSGLANADNILTASAIIAMIYLTRFAYFKITRGDKENLIWFVAPRGLITILLFYSIPTEVQLPMMNQDVLLLVILISVAILATGSLFTANKSAEIMTICPQSEENAQTLPSE